MHYFFYLLNNSNFFPYYIVTPCPYAIGTACLNIRLALIKSKQKKKILFIFVPKIFTKYLNYSICNKFLFDKLFKSQNENIFIKIIFNLILTIIFIFRRILALTFLKIFNIKLAENFFFLEIGIRDDEYEKNINLNDKKFRYNFSLVKNIKIPNKETSLSKKILKKLNIGTNQEFVCLHVRDHMYRNDTGRRDFRNSNIENYYELINFLLKKKIAVFRMGLKVDKKVKINNKLFFDLPFMNINYDFFNFFLIKNCKFFVGTQSGILDTAFLFNKDCLITNIVRIFETPPYTKKSRAICKIPFVKKTKKLLNLNNYLDLPYSAHHEYFINDKYDYIENTSEELLIAIKSFLKIINLKHFSKKNYKNNELIFKSYLTNRFAKLYYNDRDLIHHNQKSKLFKILLSSKGVYMSSFIKKHFIGEEIVS